MVVENLDTVGSEFLGARQTFLGIVYFAHAPVNLGHPQVAFGGFRLELGEALVLVEGLLKFVLGDERLSQAAVVTGIIGIDLNGFAVGCFGLVVLLGLRVGVTEQIVQAGGFGTGRRAAQKVHRLLRLALVEQQLAKLFKRGLVVGLALQHTAQNFLRFAVLVLEAIESGKPERGVVIGGVNLQDLFKLRDGFTQRRLLHLSGV